MTIGVFIAFLNDSYQRGLWGHILREAEVRGISVVGFCGHGLGAPVMSQATMNLAYKMAGPRSLDGLIVLTNTLGTFHGPGMVSRLLEGRHLPTVSLGFNLDRVSSVSARGAQAMSDLVRHLIHDHGRRKLALVTGPEGHLESTEREAAFRRVLAEEGVVFQEALLHRGSFYTVSGREAVSRFVASGLEFDAIVCLNDHMAIGAQETLRTRGYRVPDDVAVTGFDDIDEARWVSPPLTTVRQPLEALAVRAFETILELIAGVPQKSSSFDCAFIARQSCGCPPQAPLNDGVGSGDSLALTLVLDRAAVGDVPGVLGALSRSVMSQWGRPGVLDWWRRRLLENQAGPCPVNAGPRWSDQAMAWLGEEELRWEKESRMAQEDLTETIRQHSVRLLGLLDRTEIVRYGEDHFPSLGIPRSFLVLFEGPPPLSSEGEPPAMSRWLTTQGQPDRRLAEISFDTSLLVPPVPGFTWGTMGWLVEPLVSQDEALGYLLLECGDRGTVGETLRETLSTAVKGVLLMEEVRGHKNNLECQVRDRTRELRAVHRDLQEVSNRTMQAIGQDIHDDLCQHLVGISMLASVAEETVASGRVLSRDAMAEIRGLIDAAVLRSRQFARTLYPPGLEEHGLVSALEDLVDTLGRPRGTVTFTTEGDCRPRGGAPQALQLYRIVQESLSNAVRHSGSEVILVRLVRQPDGLLAEVRDFGKGLSPGAIGSGMGTRILLHRAESIGARLEIYNLDPGVCVSCFLGDQGG